MNRKQTIHNHIRLPKNEFAHSVFKCTPLKFYIDFKYTHILHKMWELYENKNAVYLKYPKIEKSCIFKVP